MSDAILVLNAGSSSIKFGVYDIGSLDRLCRGKIDDIGDVVRFSVDGELSDRFAGDILPPADGNHGQLTSWLLAQIDENLVGVTIRTAGHRVVHGGAVFNGPERVTADVLDKLEAYVPLAPNHQPHNLAAIRAVASEWPGVEQVACFDTAFHRTQPRLAQLFALPRELTDEGILRYGFHGLSYEYIAGILPDYAGERARGKVIVAHLGHGASMCALENGQSVATSMGFTALDGLMMGKRCGALDPGVVLYLIQQRGMSADDVSNMLRKQSGLLGVSGLNDDMRDLLAADNPHAREAIDLFVYRAGLQLGSLVAALGGIDVLVFTAGIGEHSPDIRRRICEAAAWAGVQLDVDANRGGGPLISTPQSNVDVFVVPTNEEIVIARSTKTILANQ